MKESIRSPSGLSGFFQTGMSTFRLVEASTPGATTLAIPALATLEPNPYSSKELCIISEGFSRLETACEGTKVRDKS